TREAESSPYAGGAPCRDSTRPNAIWGSPPTVSAIASLTEIQTPSLSPFAFPLARLPSAPMSESAPNLLPLPRLLSVVVPLYNEQEIVGELCRRILEAVRSVGCPFELVLVDDGSRDQTRARLVAAAAAVPEMRIVCLSRNFGLQGAVAAGLAHATGAAVVLMDGDLQDPPELISELVARWRRGAEVVFTVKRSRKERGLRRLAFSLFHALFRRLGPRGM